MKKLFGLVCIAALSLFSACSYVGPGEEGVRVTTVGSDRGIDGPLKQGYYFTGFTQSVYSFPTFTQNYTWDHKNNEAITFSDSGGLAVTTDIGISYHVDPTKVVPLFTKYRRGIDEITDIYLHNMVRDALVEEGSKHPVEYIYGEGRPAIIQAVQDAVSKQVADIGIIIEKVYWIGKLDLPPAVTASINAKIQATQTAQQKQNELASATADANKVKATAEGEAARVLTTARAQAEANRILAQSITPELVEYQKALKWDGKLPQVTGSSTAMFLNTGR